MLSYLLILVRLPLFVLWLASGLLVTGLVFPLVGRSTRRWVTRTWSYLLLLVFGVRLVIKAPPSSAHLQGLMVSNHSSWLDIFVTNAVQAVRFISKSEIRDWPILGTLVTLAGTLYVERGNRHRINHTNEEIRVAVESGDLVGFYPEGTTTDGTYLLQFKTNLFQPAVTYGMVVYPVVVMYRKRGQPTLLASYEGDMTFAQSFFGLMRATGLEAHISFGAPIDSRDFADRAALAAAAQSAIMQMSGLSVRYPSDDQALRLKGERG